MYDTSVVFLHNVCHTFWLTARETDKRKCVYRQTAAVMTCCWCCCWGWR